MQKSQSLFSAVVLVSALGYFVDVFDLVLFGMVRVANEKNKKVKIIYVKSNAK